ncbi:MAG TPA: bifunctional riboflavin kinase/FAD synthetase [Saprospiraceae bacterium]|nr:bifunctional riboflavin kinase/FAD synthetase [Saprospiraceae bacterium]
MQVHKNIQQLPAFRNAAITVGSFDGVHVGHRTILRKLMEVAKQNNGESVVITFYPHPRHFLGDTPLPILNTLSEKVNNLEKMGIDHLVVVPFDEAFAKQSATDYIEQFLLKKFHPKSIILGYDHRFGAGRKGDIQLLRKLTKGKDIQIIEIPANEINKVKVSSTKIRNALLEGDVKTAQTYLKQPYSISGTVIHGDQVGTQLGFPTANIKIDDPDKLIPADGVYAVLVRINGKIHQGMLHIGNRPTLNGVEQRIEVHIFDFEQKIYQQSIEIQFIDFIRHNHKFEHLDDLKNQLEKDKQIAKKILQSSNQASTAVVILNYNGTQHLQTYMPSVLANTPNDIELIVADNGSTDQSIAYLKELKVQHPRIKIIELPKNYGFAGGYNEALKQVDADIYILLNSDVRVTPNWTAPLLKAMQDPDLSVCQPKILSDINPTQFEYAGASGGYIDFLGYPFCRGRVFGVNEEDHGQYDDEREIFWATGAAMVIRSKLFWDFKGFDATFFAHNEEIDMCWQIKRAGYKIKSIPSSVVYHLGGGTLSYNTPNKVYLNFRNNLKMLVKNDTKRHLIWKLPARLILDGAAAALFLFQRQYRLIWSILRAHFAFYACMPQLIRKRREIKKILDSLPNKPITKPQGIYPKSIVWKFYAQGKDKFSELDDLS